MRRIALALLTLLAGCLALLPFASDGASAVPRRVIIRIANQSVATASVLAGDTIKEVTARPYDQQGRPMLTTMVAWFAPASVRVLGEYGSFGQRAKIVGVTPGTAVVVASSFMQGQTVKDTLIVTVTTPPADTLPTYVRLGCALPTPERVDSIVDVITTSPVKTDTVRLYYYKIAGKTVIAKGDSSHFPAFKVAGYPQSGDTLMLCPPHL